MDVSKPKLHPKKLEANYLVNFGTAYCVYGISCTTYEFFLKNSVSNCENCFQYFKSKKIVVYIVVQRNWGLGMSKKSE